MIKARLSALFLVLVLIPTCLKADAGEDPYCSGWDEAQKQTFLSALPGKDFNTGPPVENGARFLFYFSPAIHGHGAPEGSCGMRVMAYQVDAQGNTVLSGRWDDSVLSRLMDVIPGDHYCYFSALGDLPEYKTKEGAFIINAKGQVLWSGPWGVLENACWTKFDDQESFWSIAKGSITLAKPDGTPIWSRTIKHTYYGVFFSQDKNYAFTLLEDKPQRGSIFHVSGTDTSTFEIPFASEKAQKTFFGLNKDGNLALRVNRRLYVVDHSGRATLRGLLPHYPGLHPSIETERSGILFNVGYKYARVQRLDYEHVGGYKKNARLPSVRFDIDDFIAEESWDKGKTWAPLKLESGN